MTANWFRTKARGRHRLLFSLFAAAIVFLLWTGPGRCEAGNQAVNVSGNLNRALSVDPIRKSEGYSVILYDNRNGLPTSEANAVAQTGEGFLWIGSYAGLIRYDGNTFERMAGISNVRCLYVDSRDRLWIGTNDSGVFLMSRGQLANWGKADGLESVSIRAMTEDEDGLICVGSTSGIALIDEGMNLTVLQDERLAGQTIRELRHGTDGRIYGLTSNGDLFTMRGGKLLSFLSQEECRVKDILAILPDPANPGNLYLGTRKPVICYGSLETNFASLGVKDISSLSYTECLEYIDGDVWICAGNGIGKLDAEGFHRLYNVPMDNSVERVITDYEGNLWFASTRQGIMKIVPNQFSDLSERYGIPTEVVNTTCMNGRQLFIGNDTGLTVVEDRKALSSLPLTAAVTASGADLGAEDLLSYLDGVRIRSVIRDSGGRIWISTWRSLGLLCYDQGKLTAFTPEDGLFSNQVRVVSEREDGSLLVVNTGGVNVIRDGAVTEAYGEQDGILSAELLTAVEGFRHETVVGSDGDGIYIVGENETRHITTENGLGSDVILRIRRSQYHDVYWIVTSNSLAFMTPDYQVTTIQQFPYSNNFDLYENSRGDVWVLSSSGIYVVSAEKLLENGPVDPVFFGITSGLPYTATANSYSEQTAGGDLYIAGSAGVVLVNMEKPFENMGKLKICLPYVDADGTRFYPDDSGSFVLPGSVRKLTVYPYVFNYSLIDPQVSYRLDGFDPADTTVSRSRLVPLDYTNLKMGAFNFILTVMDPVGRTEQTVSFRIVKGREISAGSSGTIIMISASLLLMGGTLVYSSARRKRGRLEDRLFLALFLVNIALSVGELLSYLLEYVSLPFVREFMIAGNTVYYICLAGFPYLLLTYIDYRTAPDKLRVRRRKLLYGIPWFLFTAVMLINLKTGWIFSISEENVFQSGLYDELMFIPLVPVWFYLAFSLFKTAGINLRLAAVGVLLIAVRLLWELWYPSISSTAFMYTLILVCIHLYVMNQPVKEVTP